MHNKVYAKIELVRREADREARKQRERLREIFMDILYAVKG